MFSKEMFGARLRLLRSEANETQNAVADLLGVTRTQISEIENGNRTTTVEKLSVICSHYNVTADYLLCLTDERRPLK